MHISDPESLSDDEWAARLAELKYIRQKEKEASDAEKQQSNVKR